jgi:soluble lytic murein transglycosylase-like protein
MIIPSVNVLTFLAALCLGGCNAQHTKLDLTPVQHNIYQEAKTQGVPPHIALAIAEVESKFDPKAFSAGNYGIMQIRYGTATSMGFRGTGKDLMRPETNIKYGIAYIAYCQELYKSVTSTVGCYNGAVNPKGRYTRSVISHSKKYEE